MTVGEIANLDGIDDVLTVAKLERVKVVLAVEILLPRGSRVRTAGPMYGHHVHRLRIDVDDGRARDPHSAPSLAADFRFIQAPRRPEIHLPDRGRLGIGRVVIRVEG